MAIHDRIRTTTTQTGVLTTIDVSATAPSGYKKFSATGRFAVNDANIPIVVSHQTLNEWQVCFCTYSSADQLTVNTVLASSKSDDTAVTFSAGTKDVFVANSARAIAGLRENNTFTGSNSFSNVTVSSGSASSPAVAATGDTNTGMFFPAADTIAFAEGGVEVMRIDANSNVGINKPGGITNFGAGYRTLELAGTTGGGVFRSSSDNAIVDLYAEAALSIGVLRTVGSYPLRIATNSTERLRLDAGGNVVINTAAIATSATDGFLYLPSTAGQPTGTPTAYTGRVPVVANTANNTINWYSGGGWRNGVQEFATVSAVNAARIDANHEHIRTAGYYTAGDGGGGVYKKGTTSNSTPTDRRFIYSLNPGGSPTYQYWELAEIVPNVKQFGAYGDDTNQLITTAAFQDAYSYAPNGSTIVIPPGTYNYTTFSDTKFVHWHAQGKASGNVSFDLPGLVQQDYGVSATGRKTFHDRKTAGDDYASVEISRTANHTGGSVGSVSAALRVNSTVGANATNFEWGVLSVMDVSATAGESTAIYGQAFKSTQNAGPVWAGVFEVDDYAGLSNPTSAIYGIEVDVVADGTDNNNVRRGVDIIGYRKTASGTAQFGYGLVIQPSSADGANVVFKNGIALEGNGSFQTGVNLRNATFTTAAVWIGDGQGMLWGGNGNASQIHDTGLDLVEFRKNTTTGNSVAPALSVCRTANGTFAAGLGTALDFRGETADNNFETGARAAAEWTDVTNGSEDCDFKIYTQAAGAAPALRATINDTGIISQGVVRCSDAAADTDAVNRQYFRANAPFVIAKGTVSNVAQLDIVLTSYANLYRHIEVDFHLVPATDGTALYLRFSTDGGLSYNDAATDYNHTRIANQEGGSMIAAGSGGADAIVLAAAIGNGSNEGIGGTLRLYNPANTALWTKASFTGTYIDNAATPTNTIVQSGGSRESAQDTDAFRLVFASGNISTGSYTVIGKP